MESDSRDKPICVDLFCGAGGLSDGLRQAGFRPVMGVDFDKNAIETYKQNHKSSVSICDDISNVTSAQILDACDGQELDLLAGGPSCQGYSTHGKRVEDDPRNFLFQHFIRLAKEVRPKWILIENVKGMLTFRQGHFRKLICESLEQAGYDVDAKVLCAADYGVPQLRNRIFFLATRTGVPVSFPEPTHRPEAGRKSHQSELFSDNCATYVTVNDAIGDLPLMKGNLTSEDWDYATSPASEFQRYARQYNPLLTSHQSNGISDQAGKVIRFIGEGQGLRAVPPEHLPDRFKKMRTIGNGALRRDCTTLYHRLDRQAPAYTITCYFRNIASGPFLHPLEDRSLSYREAARLMSFQDRFKFYGTGLARQIGNAVPPLLAKAVGKHLADLLAEHLVDKQSLVLA